MQFRQKFLGFTGGLMVVYGLAMMSLGKDTAYLESVTDGNLDYVNGAAGIPMWTGIILVMCGLANLVQAFDKPKKSRSYYALPFSITVFFANFIALTVAAVCMGLLSWSLYGRYLEPVVPENTFNEAVVGLYATIIIASSFIFICALMAMFIDCCMDGFMGLGGPMLPPPVRESPYDSYNRPAAIYKH